MLGARSHASRRRTARTPGSARIQNDLFDLGADLCVPEEERRDRQSERERTRLRVAPEQVAWLEARCDEVNDGLPPLTLLRARRAARRRAAALHLARTVCRRAERETVALAARASRSARRRCSTSTGSPTCSSCSPAPRIRRAGRCSGCPAGSAADGTPRARQRRTRRSRASRSIRCTRRRRRRWTTPGRWAIRAYFPTPAGPTPRCTGATCGRCACSRASVRRTRRTSASTTCSSRARRASRRPSTCRR